MWYKWLDLDTIRAEEFWVFVRPVERPLRQCVAGDFATLCWRLTVGLWEAAELWLFTAALLSGFAECFRLFHTCVRHDML